MSRIGQSHVGESFGRVPAELGRPRRSRRRQARRASRHAVQRPRRAYSLIEMQVVIVAASVVLSTMAVMLHAMYRAEQKIRQELQRRAAISRLSVQLRTDAHAAVSAELRNVAGQKGQTQLVLRSVGGPTVQYRARPGRIDRLERRGNELVRRDSFLLPGEPSVPLAVADDGPGQRVTAAITSPSPQGAGDREPSVWIEAAVGLDQRYGGSTEP